MIGLGTAAAEKGFRVRYALATRLVNDLVEVADEKNLARTIAHYGRVDLLMIDELGYMELTVGTPNCSSKPSLSGRRQLDRDRLERVLLGLDEDFH